MQLQHQAYCLIALFLLLAGCDAVEAPTPASRGEGIAEEETFSKKGKSAEGKDSSGRIIVANRGSGTISVVDAATDRVTTIALPAGANTPEPMYVVYAPVPDRVFVGDRANNQIVAFDAQTFAVEGTVPAGGIFHMWSDLQNSQLWVVDNVNDELTVIDPQSLTVITTIEVEGGTPHDVILDPPGDFAFSTLFVEDGLDQVVKYSTSTFMEVDRTNVGENPHVSLRFDTVGGNAPESSGRQDNLLYVAAQGTDEVVVLNRDTLSEETALPIPNAHGVGMAQDGMVFYTTNIADGGIDGLFAVDTQTKTIIGSVDTPFSDAPIPTPHNIAITSDSRKLYITHSGAMSDKLSIYKVEGNNPLPQESVAITVGLNPFGIAFVP